MEFQYKGKRYRESTEQLRREDALQVEADLKQRLRQQSRGLLPPDRIRTPSFSAWAETCVSLKRQRLGRADVYERTMRMVLAFWGARPRSKPPVDGGVYHDLRLADPIDDGSWIDRFEAWMAGRKLSGSTKNSYRSAMSGMYKLALRPRYRQRTGIMMNPFDYIDRDRVRKRILTVNVLDVRKWISHAAPHAVVAMTIGALAPKLRLDQVLSLRFDKHFDRAMTTITFENYKSQRHREGAPQVTAIPEDLQAVLQALKKARPGATYVVTFRGRPVKDIKTATRSAAARAGLDWGIKLQGLTFHALRHAFATEAGRLGINKLLTARALDHADPRTTDQFYTHLAAEDERPTVNRMAEHFQLKDIALKAVGLSVGTSRKKDKHAQGRTAQTKTGHARRRAS